MIFGEKFLNCTNRSLIILDDCENISNLFSESYIIEGAFDGAIKSFFNKIRDLILKLLDWIRKAANFLHEKFNNLINKLIEMVRKHKNESAMMEARIFNESENYGNACYVTMTNTGRKMIQDFIDSTSNLTRIYNNGYQEMYSKLMSDNDDYVEWAVDFWNNKIQGSANKDIEKYNATYKYFSQSEHTLLPSDSRETKDSFANRIDADPDDTREFEIIINNIKNESSTIDKSLKSLDKGITELKKSTSIMENIITRTDQKFKQAFGKTVEDNDENRNMINGYMGALKFAVKQMTAIASGSITTYGKISRLITIVTQSNTTFLTRIIFDSLFAGDYADGEKRHIDRSYDYRVPTPPKQEEFRDRPRRLRIM